MEKGGLESGLEQLLKFFPSFGYTASGFTSGPHQHDDRASISFPQSYFTPPLLHKSPKPKSSMSTLKAGMGGLEISYQF